MGIASTRRIATLPLKADVVSQYALGSRSFTGGTYVQLTAATSADVYLIGVSLTVTATGNANISEWEIGWGGAGAETVLVNGHVGGVATYSLSVGQSFPPIRVPSGTRLAVRTVTYDYTGTFALSYVLASDLR